MDEAGIVNEFIEKYRANADILLRTLPLTQDGRWTMIIYVHDPRSPFDRNVAFDTHKAAADVKHVFITTTMSMPQVAQEVIKKAGKAGNIWVLLLPAHGNKGWLRCGVLPAGESSGVPRLPPRSVVFEPDGRIDFAAGEQMPSLGGVPAAPVETPDPDC